MIHAIFTFFIFSFLLRRWLRPKAYGVWVGVSLLALAQVSQPTLLAVFALLGIHEIIFLIHRRWRLDGRFFPLIYAASLIALHHILRLNISGFSYLALASSLDLWLRMRGEAVLFKERFLSLISLLYLLLSMYVISFSSFLSYRVHFF